MQKKIILSHIAAVSTNNVIGLKNKLPWHIPEDLKYFYKTTKNKVLIMGRKTFQSLGKPLSKRLNIVLTSNKDFKPEGTVLFSSFDEALNYCRQDAILEKYGQEIFVTGGGEIFKQTLPLMDRLYITRIHKDYEGDAFYPKIPMDQFKEVSRIDRSEPLPFSFFDLREEIRPFYTILIVGLDQLSVGYKLAGRFFSLIQHLQKMRNKTVSRVISC